MVIRKEVWDKLIRIFGRYEYCILRNYENLPEISNDLDILVKKKDIKNIKNELIEGLRDVNVCLIRYAPFVGDAIYFLDKNTNNIYHIDLIPSFEYHFIEYLNVNEVLKNRIKFRDFYIPSAKHEFWDLLFTKFIYTGKVKEKYYNKIFKLWGGHTKEIKALLENEFGKKLADLIEESINEKSFFILEENYSKILKKIIYNNFKRPFSFLKTFNRFAKRGMNKIIKQNGFWVVLLGPDGSGKSTLAKVLGQEMKDLFKDSFIFHWRPGVLPQIYNVLKKQDQQNISNPHSLKIQNPIISFFRIIYYWFDYIIGYYIKIFVKRQNSNFIIFDRYFYDFYIDPIRFRLSTPLWLTRFFIFFVQKPDLVVILKNEPDVILNRKAEISKEQIIEQYSRISDLQPFFPISVQVDTTLMPEVLSKMIKNKIINIISERKCISI